MHKFKTARRFHRWQVTDGYDPRRDGADPTYGRKGVRCSKCGEERRVFGELEPGRRGCTRRALRDTFRRGDMVVTSDEALSQFLRRVSATHAEVYNDGGWTKVYPISDMSRM